MTAWWNKNVEARMDDFKVWIGDFNHPSKIYCRQYIAQNNYKSVLDCGCGLASDYYGFKSNNINIEYTGLDSCKYLVNLNLSHDIPMIESELEADLPILDSQYECVYCREVLEHLSYYEKTVAEMIRCASKEVIITFFIEPTEVPIDVELVEKLDLTEDGAQDSEKKITVSKHSEINYWKEEDLYHNKYNKEKLEKFILSNSKVDRIFWKEINDYGYSIKEEEKSENLEKQVNVLSENVESVVSNEKALEQQVEPKKIEQNSELTNKKFILHILLKQ